MELEWPDSITGLWRPCYTAAGPWLFLSNRKTEMIRFWVLPFPCNPHLVSAIASTEPPMESQAHVTAWSMPTTIHVSSRVFNRKHALLAIVLSFVQCLAALQNPLIDFCRRYGHQSTVIDDKLYIDGGWVDYLDDFPEDHRDYPSK